MNTFQNIQLLIIQATGFCNIDCSYCYLPERNQKQRMSRNVLLRIAEEIIASKYMTEETLILWHAGEPLSIPLVWYQDAYDILLSTSNFSNVKFQFQSNGTIFDKNWVRFLNETGSNLGLSIDGPEFIHDYYRKDRFGRGTHKSVMQTVQLLKESNIPFTNIATITNVSLDNPDLVFDFFYDIKPVRLGLSIEEAEGANMNSSLYKEEFIGRVEEFFERITSLNLKTTTPLRIREVENVISKLMVRDILTNSQESQLGSIVSVAVDGNISFFSPELLTSGNSDESRGISGNILIKSFDDIYQSTNINDLSKEIDRGVKLCLESCEFFRFCGGGSPANKFGEHGRYDVTETCYCRLSKQAAVRGILKAISRTE